MATVAESVCCMEIPKTKEKVEAEESSIACITSHPGFDAMCGSYKLHSLHIDIAMEVVLFMEHL